MTDTLEGHNNTFDIYLLKEGKEDQYLGTMPSNAVTFNRYDEGFLVAAGRISGTSSQNSVFMHFSAKFRDMETLEFRCKEITYQGTFRFINFDPDSRIVVFGSVGPVYDVAQEPTESSTAKQTGLTSFDLLSIGY